MKKFTAILFMVILFLSSSAYAISFEEKPISNVIIPQLNQNAEIELIIYNASPGDYNIYTLTDVEISPWESFNIDSKEKSIILTIRPLESLSTRGYYSFVYYVRNSNGTNYDDKMTVKVVDFKDVMEISSDSNYPSAEMTFFIKNKENINLENLTATFSSVFFETEKTFSLKPLEKKEFTIPVDQEKLKKIPAGSYLIESNFNLEGQEQKLIGKIYFGEKREIESESSKEGFFIRTESEKKFNSGNTREVVRITATKSLFFVPFTFFNVLPDETKTTFFKKEYSWTRELGPGEELQVISKTNYLLIVLILLLAAALITFLAKRNSKRLEIRKSVSHVKTKGGEFALRVRVHLKVHKDLDNVSIIERIPAIAKVHENFGALKPTSINLKERKLRWDFGTLKKGDDRIFSYVIYSKVGVVGKFSLPAALAIFEENGNISETFSNKVFFLSEQVKK